MLDYNAGLTGEPFLYPETKLLAKFILDGEISEDLRKRNLKENLLQYKSTGSLSRINTPIFRRLGVLTKYMLGEFVNSDIDTSKFILLYAIMKTDRLIFEFINEVYREKIILKRDYIDKTEFDNFFEEKGLYSEKLKNLPDTTKYKLRQVTFKVMVDSGLVQKEKDRFKVVRPLLKQTFIDMIEANGDKEYIVALKGGAL